MGVGFLVPITTGRGLLQGMCSGRGQREKPVGGIWVLPVRLWPPAQGEEVTRGHGRGPHSVHSASNPHGHRLA